jgi:hypothetical protein
VGFLPLEKKLTAASLLTNPVPHRLSPLFDLKWQGRTTTLEEGQEKLLQHLGKGAARLAPLHGPIMPQPWSWAPLVLAGTSGFLQSEGDERPLYSDGLRGRWAAWRILKVLGKADLGREGYSTRLARLTETCYNWIKFRVEGTSPELLRGPSLDQRILSLGEDRSCSC